MMYDILINVIYELKIYNNVSRDLFFCKYLQSVDMFFFDVIILIYKFSCSMDVQVFIVFKMELYNVFFIL